MNAGEIRARNLLKGTTSFLKIACGPAGEFVEVGSGRGLADELRSYSRMKFGDVEAIQWSAGKLAGKVIEELKGGGSLREMFEVAGAAGEHVYLTAPGVRNVISASNRLMRQTALRVNAYLALEGLPTMICKPLTRLGSGRANYAQLSAEGRKGRHKTTKSIVPRSDFEEHGIHVVFLDDVEVTGATVERAKTRSLEAGARSFHSLFALQVDPDVAAKDPGIEHRMNQFEVVGGLDDVLLRILSHDDYQPVQRMLRLLLHPKNRPQLSDFVAAVKNPILLRLYTCALSNDYLSIRTDQDPNHSPLYADSVHILRMVLHNSGFVDQQGLII